MIQAPKKLIKISCEIGSSFRNKIGFENVGINNPKFESTSY